MVSEVREGWCRYVHCSDHPAPCLTFCQCVPTCCVTVTMLHGDSHGHSVALEQSSDTRWEPIDRCCHLSFNTVKWMTHCQHSVQRATQLSYCPCVVPALVRSTRAFASNFPAKRRTLAAICRSSHCAPSPLSAAFRALTASLWHCREETRLVRSKRQAQLVTDRASRLRRPDISSSLAFCDSHLNIALQNISISFHHEPSFIPTRLKYVLILSCGPFT